MIRVALVSPLFESVPPRLYGGTERVIYNLCKGLTDSDIQVTLFASGDSCVEGRMIPVVKEAFRLRPDTVKDPHAYNIRLLDMVARHAGEFDLIHNHHDYWMLPLAGMTRTPVLSTLHGRLDLPDIPAAMLSFPGNAFVSISDSQRGPMAGLNWLRTIHHGLDLEEFKFYPKPGRYLAFLGRISVEKRPDWAIRIAQRSGVPLKIAAKIEGEKEMEYFNARIRPHIDGKSVEFIGEISEAEKSQFLGEALAMVFPIDWPEPFGLVMIESLACGTPVLARPLGSVPELLQDGVTGYCDDDVDNLAKRVADIERIDRKECRNWVERRFSLGRMTEDYIDAYRQLIRATCHRRNILHSV